jgi:FKBP-type peptidyl-prolyl cis-trans isomerase 2
MEQAKNGDRVKINYTGKLEDGNVFDSSHNRPPLDFVVGNGDVMPGIENGVIGMEVGDTKTIEILTEEAFGPRRKELVAEVMKGDIPNHITPSIGQRLQIRMPDDQNITVTITEMNEDTVTLDANHPLAGYTLLFDIELVEIS